MENFILLIFLTIILSIPWIITIKVSDKEFDKTPTIGPHLIFFPLKIYKKKKEKKMLILFGLNILTFILWIVIIYLFVEFGSTLF